MNISLFLLAPVFGLLLGGMLLQYLTVPPLEMEKYQFFTSLALFGLLVILAVAYARYVFLLTFTLALCGALGGYLWQTHRFLSRVDERPLPELTRSPEDESSGHAAVIYFAHGEPEQFDPIGWLNQFREFDNQGVAFIPFLARPFFIYLLRRKYLKVGLSEHHKMHRRMLEKLEGAFRQAGDSTTRFYLAFLDDHPNIQAALIQALNDGAARVVISEVFLTPSNHTAEGRYLIEALNPAQYGVTVDYTGPLWNSEQLQRMFPVRAGQARGATPKEKTAILLVGHGQPQAWDEAWPEETSREIGFREAVLRLFEAEGYPPENLGVAWMEFREPKPAEAVERFAALGVEKVLYFSAAISAASIHSKADVPELVEQAEIPAEIALINLGAWNDDPMVISAIQEKIEAVLGVPQDETTT